MKNQLTPELIEDIREWLQRKDGDTQTLSFFFEQATGLKLKVHCSICVSDAKEYLKRITLKQTKMTNYKWIGGNASIIFRGDGGKLVKIDKTNITDEWAEKISAIPKYAHNVQYVGELVKPKVELMDLKEVSQVGTSISTEVLSEEPTAKKRGRKPKLK